LGATHGGVQVETPESNIRCIAKPENLQITQIQRICVATASKISVYTFVVNETQVQNAEEVTMPAIAEFLSTIASQPDPRGCDLPTCPVCADSMIAAEASAYLTDHAISYLWTCDTCGYGFVTKHSVKRFQCN
jgi:hypothetical protein